MLNKNPQVIYLIKLMNAKLKSQQDDGFHQGIALHQCEGFHLYDELHQYHEFHQYDELHQCQGLC